MDFSYPLAPKLYLVSKDAGPKAASSPTASSPASLQDDRYDDADIISLGKLNRPVVLQYI